MPIYEYTCTACHHDFELLVRSSRDGNRVNCPACGSSAVDRQLSVFSAQNRAQGRSEPSGGGPCGRCGDPNGPCAL